MHQLLETVYEGEVEVVPDNFLDEVRCSFVNLQTGQGLTKSVNMFDLAKYGIRTLKEGDTLRYIKGPMGADRYQKIS